MLAWECVPCVACTGLARRDKAEDSEPLSGGNDRAVPSRSPVKSRGAVDVLSSTVGGIAITTYPEVAMATIVGSIHAGHCCTSSVPRHEGASVV